MDDLGVPSAGRQHQCRLVILVESRAWLLVPSREQSLAYVLVAKRSGEVEVRVGQAKKGGIGIVEDGRVRFEYAPDEEGVACVDRASHANRGLDPGELEARTATAGANPQGRLTC